MNDTDYRYSIPTKLIHMGLALFGIFAYLTAEGAESGEAGFGYLLHAYPGLTLMAFIILRAISGYTGERHFSSGSIFSRTQWLMAIEDIKGLLQFKIPVRSMHEGISGLVQTFGLVVFAWMGATGTALYFINESVNGSLYEIIEEAHEVGEGLIPLFLTLHVGAVVLHSLMGRPNWQKIWRFKK